MSRLESDEGPYRVRFGAMSWVPGTGSVEYLVGVQM
jgi:hypothetical protein